MRQLRGVVLWTLSSATQRPACIQGTAITAPDCGGGVAGGNIWPPTKVGHGVGNDEGAARRRRRSAPVRLERLGNARLLRWGRLAAGSAPTMIRRVPSASTSLIEQR